MDIEIHFWFLEGWRCPSRWCRIHLSIQVLWKCPWTLICLQFADSFLWNTTATRTAPKPRTEREGLSEWAPSKRINGNSLETEETHRALSICRLQQRQCLPTLACFVPKTSSHHSWLMHTARTLPANGQIFSFNFFKRVMDTRALGGDHCIDGERWDWPSHLPINMTF